MKKHKYIYVYVFVLFNYRFWHVRFCFLQLQVLAFLSLAAACSTASVTELLMHASQPNCPAKLCNRYQISAATAFLSWFMLFASSLFNLWLLASL